MTEIFKDWPRFDGAATWPTLTSQQQAEIGAIALELVVASHGLDVAYRSELEDTPESRPFLAAEPLLFDQLENTVSDMIADIVPALDDHQLPTPIPSLLGQICRVCGCSHCDPCEHGCSWAEPDLCTACVEGGHK